MPKHTTKHPTHITQYDVDDLKKIVEDAAKKPQCHHKWRIVSKTKYSELRECRSCKIGLSIG